MLEEALDLVSRGVACHWLRHHQKAPIDEGWQKAPIPKPAALRAAYRDGYNLGFRPGEFSEVADGLFLYVIDVDVKGGPEDEDEAYDELARILPDWKKFPFVNSGRGGGSAHIYVVSAKSYPSKILAKSGRKVKWTDGSGKVRESNAWEIERLGTGKNCVLPPSIHPDTGRAYQWGREIDWDALDAIEVDDEIDDPDDDGGGGGGADIQFPDRRRRGDDDTASLSEINQRKKCNLGLDEAWEYLLDLPLSKWCFNREGWLDVGMALHHEFDGSQEGLELWHAFSKLEPDKYWEGGPEYLDERWVKFGTDRSRRPVTMRTIINGGAHTRLRRDHNGAEPDDPMTETEDDDAWLSRLTLNDKGEVRPTSDNIELILANDVRFRSTFAKNRFIEDVCVRNEPPMKMARSEKRQGQMRQLDSWLWKLSEIEQREGRPIEDDHLDELRVLIESPVKRGGYGVRVSDRDLRAALAMQANKNAFHPVQDFLNTLEWDGKKRLDYVFIDYLGCDDDAYHRQTCRLLFLAAVTRAFQHGHKFDYVPILEGPQGIRKSSFVKVIGRDWYVELDCPFDDPKRVVETLVGQWVAEIPELQQFSRAEVAAIKAFFSKGEEKVREAYGRKAKRFLRQSVYVGTTNDREYLRDPTGNRRFWPIQCRVAQIDTDRLERNIKQIWAEAVARYRELASDYPPGKLPLFLTGEAKTTALTLQESRVVETQTQGWAGEIMAWADTRVRLSEVEGLGEDFKRADGPDPLVKREMICGYQVWLEVMKGTREAYGRGNSLKVIEAIRATGAWEDAGRQRMPVYGLQRVFVRAKRPRRSTADLLGE